MKNNITLTNDEIHAIRMEHSERTKHLPFEEYKRQLDAEIALRSADLRKLKKEI